MTCEQFLPSDNPRVACCRRCGRLNKAHPQREVEAEAEFFRDLETLVGQRFSIDAGPFLRHLHARLEQGAKEYGPLAYLHPDRDNAREGTEEQADSGAYALFESLVALRHARDGMDDDVADGVRMWMLEAAVHSAYADWCFRQGRAMHREAWAPR